MSIENSKKQLKSPKRKLKQLELTLESMVF